MAILIQSRYLFIVRIKKILQGIKEGPFIMINFFFSTLLLEDVEPVS